MEKRVVFRLCHAAAAGGDHRSGLFAKLGEYHCLTLAKARLPLGLKDCGDRDTRRLYKLRVCLQAHEVDSLAPGQDRDTFSIDNFTGWLDWAAQKRLGMDIAPVYYSHPKLDMGLSLSHPDAMYNLGLLLMEGDGIGQDYKQAMELFGRAAELGVEDAADALKLVRKQLGV